MATEQQMDTLIDSIDQITSTLETIHIDQDTMNGIEHSLFRIAEALERAYPPPPKQPLTPANNYWKRKEWEEQNGKEWIEAEQQ